MVLLHWGMEHYHYPCPQHRSAAVMLAEAGVDLVIGHHPHVVQGVEKIDKSLVAYSLENFMFDEFPWSLEIGKV